MPQHLKPKQRLHRHLHLKHRQLKHQHPLMTQAMAGVIMEVDVDEDVGVDEDVDRGKRLRNQ